MTALASVLRRFHQSQQGPNPLFVVTCRNIAEQLPGFSVSHVCSRRQNELWSQCFQFEKIVIRKYFKVAAKIRIRRCRRDWSMLDEQEIIAEVSSPTRWVEDAGHLFLIAEVRVPALDELDVLRTKPPSRIGQIGKGPEG